LSVIFFNIRRSQTDVTINAFTSSCKVSVILVTFLMELNFLDRSLKNAPISRVTKIRPVGAHVFQEDGRRDGEAG
jgi:hypothetical protein